MNLKDKFYEYLEQENDRIDDNERLSKDLADIATKHQVVVAEGEVSKEVDDIFINFPLADFVVGSYHLGHKNSSPFKKYEGKKIKIIVEVEDEV